MATHENPENHQLPLKILYQDNDLVAIDKPSGMLVHRSSLDSLETVFALQLLRDQIGKEVFPCHRLDKPTSGILLFALSKEILTAVQDSFINKRVSKTYVAAVRGWAEEGGLIDYALRSEENPDKIQDAKTEYHCLARSTIDRPVGRYPSGRFSLLELNPQTGRKHQLRRHLAHIRHPILGDTRHGDGAQNRFIREYCNCHRLMLRATQLRLTHPASGEELKLKADEEPEFTAVLEALKLV